MSPGLMRHPEQLHAAAFEASKYVCGADPAPCASESLPAAPASCTPCTAFTSGSHLELSMWPRCRRGHVLGTGTQRHWKTLHQPLLGLPLGQSYETSPSPTSQPSHLRQPHWLSTTRGAALDGDFSPDATTQSARRVASDAPGLLGLCLGLLCWSLWSLRGVPWLGAHRCGLPYLWMSNGNLHRRLATGPRLVFGQLICTARRSRVTRRQCQPGGSGP